MSHDMCDLNKHVEWVLTGHWICDGQGGARMVRNHMMNLHSSVVKKWPSLQARTALQALWERSLSTSTSNSASPFPKPGPPPHQAHPADLSHPENPAKLPDPSPLSSATFTITDDETPNPPPYLPRPLGVEQYPTTSPATKEEKLAKLVDEESRLRERKHMYVMNYLTESHLRDIPRRVRRSGFGIRSANMIFSNSIAEVSKGYYHDWATLRHNGNKLWTGPPSLIREEVCRTMPYVRKPKCFDWNVPIGVLEPAITLLPGYQGYCPLQQANDSYDGRV